MVLSGPVDVAAGLGVWVVGLGGLEPPRLLERLRPHRQDLGGDPQSNYGTSDDPRVAGGCNGNVMCAQSLDQVT